MSRLKPVTVIGERGVAAGRQRTEGKKTPSTNIQAPEKLQIPSFNKWEGQDRFKEYTILAQRSFFKPHRGGLFIVPLCPTLPSFLFFSGAVPEHLRIREKQQP